MSPASLCSFCILVGLDLDLIDPLTATIELLIVIRICYDLKRIDICNRMGYFCETIYQIIIGVDVNDTFNRMTVTINVFIKITILLSFLNILTTISDGIDPILAKVSEYDDNSDTTVIINTLYKVGVSTLIVVLFVHAIYFIMQVMDGLTLNITIPIEIDVIIVAMNHIALILALQSIAAVLCDIQMICNVCAIFIIFFVLFLFFVLCFFV